MWQLPYMQGIALDSGSYVKLEVNVSVPGSYRILTNTVNGYRFSDSGTFTVKGPQTIRLFSKGTPLHSGTELFTVRAGTSSCGFSVPVLPVVVTAFRSLDNGFNGTRRSIHVLLCEGYWSCFLQRNEPGHRLRRTNN
jgi:hypothetical protein